MGILGNDGRYEDAGALDARRIFVTAQEKSAKFAQNIWQAPLALPAAVVDTTVTSLANLSDMTGISDFDLHDGIMPSGWEGYQASKDAWQTTADIASLFFIAGAAQKGASATGGLARLSKHAGMSDAAVSKIFANRAQSEAIKREVVEAMEHESNRFARYGKDMSGMDDVRRSWTSLNGQLTAQEAKQQGLKLSRSAAIKETIAGELAVAALMNDSDFLFPEDGNIGTYLMGAGLGFAGAVGIDRAIATASYRVAHQARLAKSAALSAKVRKKSDDIFIDQTSDTPGSRWTVVESGGHSMRVVDEMLDEARMAGMPEDELRVLRQATAREEGQAIVQTAGAFTKMGADVPVAGDVSRAHKLDKPQREFLLAQVKQQRGLMAGVHSLEDTDVMKRYAARENQLAQIEFKLRAKGPSPELDSVTAELEELRGMQPVVLEADGVVNGMGARKTPWQELSESGADTLKRGVNARYFTSMDPQAPKLQLFQGGSMARIVGRQLESIGTESAMSFDEATAAWKLVAQGTEGSKGANWSSKFLEEFDGNMDALPYHVLDAIDEGLIDVTASTRDEVVELGLAKQLGTVGVTSFNRKMKAFVAAQNDAANDDTIFDLGKRLGLRLHTDNGIANELHVAMLKVADGGEGAHLGDTLEEIADKLTAVIGGSTTGRTQERILKAMGDRSMLSLHQKAKPIGMLQATHQQLSDTQQSLAVIAETARSTRIARLAASDEPLIRDLFAAVQESPELLAQTLRVGEIARDSVIESVSGARQLARAATTTTFRHRNMPALQGASAFGQIFERVVQKATDEMLTPVAKLFDTIKRSGAIETLAQHAQYTAAMRAGAQLVDELPQVGYNRLAAESHRVKQMVGRLFPNKSIAEITGGDDLLMFDIAAAQAGRYVPIKLDETAAHAIGELVSASYKQADLMNAISMATGRKTIEKVNGHVPVSDFSKLHIRYIGDAKTLDVTGYVTGKTRAEADRIVRDALANAHARGEDVIQRSEHEIMGYMDSVDHTHFQNLQNYGDVAKQTGSTKGRALATELDVSGDLMADQLLAMRESMSQLKNRAVYAMFEPQFLQNRQLASVGDAGAVGEARLNKDGVEAAFSPHQEWENLLLASSARPKGSAAYKLDNVAVGAMEKVMQFASGATKGWSDLSAQEQKAYQRLIDKGFAPYDEAIKALKVTNSPDDKRLAQALQQMNKVTGEVFLKFANVMHPVLNMLSLAVTTPGVMQQAVRRKGESVEDFRARAGSFAEFIDEDSGVSVVSPAKMLIEGSHFFFSGGAQSMLEDAAKRGMITSNMLEELNATLFSRPSKLKDGAEFVRKYGDVINGPYNALQRARGKTPSADTISERSEIFSRAFVHSVGYNYINRVGNKGLSEGDKQAYAHWFANQNIADYAPNIRGEAFRGVSGIPIGLFQSFGVNFLQRTFRMVENVDKRALAVQAGMQSLVFGAEGLPGFPLLNKYFMSATEKGGENDSTVSDRMYNAYGKEVGDMLLTGTVSQLPRLFGGSDGINVYASGDTNPRVQGFMPPSFSLVQQSLQGVYAGMKAGMEEVAVSGHGGGFSTQRMAEVAAAYVPNRGARSMLELAMGYKADRNGDMIVEDTRAGVALVSRLMGARMVDETRQRTAIYRNNLDLRARSERMSQVGRSLSATIRAAELSGEDLEDGFLEPYLQRYLAVGGRQDQFGRWLSTWVDKANTREVELQVAKLVKNGKVKHSGYTGLVERLGVHGVGLDTLD